MMTEGPVPLVADQIIQKPRKAAVFFRWSGECTVIRTAVVVSPARAAYHPSKALWPPPGIEGCSWRPADVKGMMLEATGPDPVILSAGVPGTKGEVPEVTFVGFGYVAREGNDITRQLAYKSPCC